MRKKLINSDLIKVVGVYRTFSTSATSGELGSAYAFLDISNDINELGDIWIRAIIPIGAFCTNHMGYPAVIAPYNNEVATHKTTHWAITASRVDTYSAYFIVLYQ